MNELMIIALLGVMIGSFLNVCIDRIPLGESILFPRSHCMKCGHILGVSELIPILSYVKLRGRCKKCHSRIASRSLWIEIVTGIGFIYLYHHYGRTMDMVITCTFFAISLILVVTDWENMLLPTSVIRCGLVVGMIDKIFQAIESRNGYYLVYAIVGATVGYLFFYSLYEISRRILKKEALGYGDIRLVSLIGLFVGVEYLFIGIFIAALTASLYGMFLLKKKRISEPYPLGPFLVVGAYIVLLWGKQILRCYMGLF